ncbi:iron-containing alcohol dehydrogenase PsrA [Cupriavidus necator]|uniref:Alcohol dehydrogenase, class IV n=1 Tax=Cupriavidus necator (strain ATCC 17699 / DSM 428 / KCTC 22496 / NCIMB 10442 / H16 / Stanier 337) TaxID=381666 RepID=Q0K301_CUPNH|nr:iron-containing alcohol dehydrogenase PsrA [Cupriavidus necator]QCC03520.1 iron-containing alcohol dehydrogenase [Cupriavidus necator H16]QQB80575.1 iron-containing alcohol dehydrogenase [Cupriavidus necator]WKA44858.1 iron-containing alcohol dehydrogenase PsrA [Cupriavidus necator]CAJ95623.1 alcohol dehydrogenase, class IV [Cupriavidus necator H16]
MNHAYHNPVSIHCGAGSLDRLPALLHGRRVVVVTFPEARALGLVARLEALLGADLAGLIEDVQPNPDVAQLSGLYNRFWEDADACDAIVAVGGGSAIDTAKALMVGTRSGRFDSLISLLATGKAFTPAQVKPLIAVPTTAGTGSEVTPWATIWDAANQKKYSLHLQATWPEAAIVDAELMMSVPRDTTISTGLDALSHALESIWNVNANPVSDTFAISAVEDIFDTLPELVRNLDDIGLRERMALAALKAGLAFSNTKTALAHSISYEMTLRHGLPHGIACSFTLPMVLEKAWARRPDRDRTLQRLFGPVLGDGQQRLRAFLQDLGVKTEFADYGVSDDEAGAMIARALDGARGKNFIGAVPA